MLCMECASSATTMYRPGMCGGTLAHDATTTVGSEHSGWDSSFGVIWQSTVASPVASRAVRHHCSRSETGHNTMARHRKVSRKARIQTHPTIVLPVPMSSANMARRRRTPKRIARFWCGRRVHPLHNGAERRAFSTRDLRCPSSTTGASRDCGSCRKGGGSSLGLAATGGAGGCDKPFSGTAEVAVSAAEALAVSPPPTPDARGWGVALLQDSGRGKGGGRMPGKARGRISAGSDERAAVTLHDADDGATATALSTSCGRLEVAEDSGLPTAGD